VNTIVSQVRCVER